MTEKKIMLIFSKEISILVPIPHLIYEPSMF